jgi:hypothetical protein
MERAMNDDANTQGDKGNKASRKIFPRNLTARAEAEPRGNPPSTRPEDGVDNCFPGYDFDHRNLEKRFFPGLTFEFHLTEDGAMVRDVSPDSLAANAGLKSEDGRRLFLWGIAGRTSASQKEEEAPRFFFESLTGLDVWARVRDLMRGPVAILLGNAPAAHAGVADKAKDALKAAFRDHTQLIQRNEKCEFQWAALFAERAEYLDGDGVIDPAQYEPGELTRSLCTPWQYDFRDCGCYYWAASKPDVVTSADGKQPYAAYMRRDRIPAARDTTNYDDRRKLEFGYAELIAGEWNETLPIVLNDREESSSTFSWPAQRIGRGNMMSRDEIVTELTYLATVEHALAVQYLFAHYSLNAPMVLPAGEPVDSNTSKIFSAANEIFQIAIDEMRHMRWVNEALEIFDAAPSLGRARVIGRSFQQPFALSPLTPSQLDWFINVEKPSRSVGDPVGPNVDGMYVRLLASVEKLPESVFRDGARERKERLVHLIKLIIDEGDDHYHRFLKVKEHLALLTPKQYLRRLCDHQNKPLNELQTRLIMEGDNKYRELLDTLRIAFSEDDGSGVFFEQARRAMRSMHENNHRLASEGIAPSFELPEGVEQTVPPGYVPPGGNKPPAGASPATGTTGTIGSMPPRIPK